MVNQQPEGYYTKAGKLNVENNAALQGCGPSSAPRPTPASRPTRPQWDWGKGKAFVDGSFATFVCPGWMLGIVKGQVDPGRR